MHSSVNTWKAKLPWRRSNCLPTGWMHRQKMPVPERNRDARSRERLRRSILKVMQRTGEPAAIYPIWKKVAAAAAIIVDGGA